VVLADGEYDLNVKGKGHTPLPETGQVEIEIERKTSVSLSGGEQFEGSVTLDPEDCKAGIRHVIQAANRPAKLVFQAGFPASELSVSCISGCSHSDVVGSKFPKIPFERGETERQIELEFKAQGYRSKKKQYTIAPGPNTLRVNLERI
jgi:hypothetical protein